MLYTLNLHNVTCHLYFNKAGKENKNLKIWALQGNLKIE